MAKCIVRNIKDVEPVPCPCGSSTRIITQNDTDVANLHVTHIQDSKKHYHKDCTEYYYILEGGGKMELDDDVVDLEPGVAILIPPGVRDQRLTVQPGFIGPWWVPVGQFHILHWIQISKGN